MKMSDSSMIGKGDHNHRSSRSEDEEEESLSLRDLPTVGDRAGEQRGIGERSSESKTVKSEVAGEFDFGSLVASLDELEAEMCAADEVFFRGQILPFRRYSVTSSSAVVSRSESMDRIAGFRGSSTASTSRSSSTRSSSINSSASAGKLPQLGHEKRPLKVRNQFHSFPSPKPYARAANAPRSSNSSTSTPSASKRSALWEIFRLGLVRMPEIKLEDLKVRCSKNQSHGIIDRSSGDGIKRVNSGSMKEEEESKKSVRNEEWRRKTQRKRRRKGGAMKLMSSGCRCSVRAVEPENGERVKVVVVNKRREEECRLRLEPEEELQGRRDVSLSRHHRTFQWLKDLSQSQSQSQSQTFYFSQEYLLS